MFCTVEQCHKRAKQAVNCIPLMPGNSAKKNSRIFAAVLRCSFKQSFCFSCIAERVGIVISSAQNTFTVAFLFAGRLFYKLVQNNFSLVMPARFVRPQIKPC